MKLIFVSNEAYQVNDISAQSLAFCIAYSPLMYKYFVIADPKLTEFIERALLADIPHQSLVGILTAQGWPEKEVYEALGEHYQRSTGVLIPSRLRSEASAKDAFFYLLIFATLATWTFGFGSLAFALIDRWITDPLFYQFHQTFESETVTYSLAALIVAFPLFLFISRVVARESTEHPEKLESPIRKWLTYMALVIAASIFMGDLIAALAFLLRGELTARFLAKSFVVLLLSGGVIFYYFGGLRKTDGADGTWSRSSRDRLMGGLSSALVALLVVLGFFNLGAPKVQRNLRADSQRVTQIHQLSSQIKNYWTMHNSQLPGTLQQLPNNINVDPITRLPYEYHAKAASQYELCATFARASDPRGAMSYPSQDFWNHPAGHYCFLLDASTAIPFPTQYQQD